jgi:dipeptidyl aminopeptidase/acylaminoacyl peptidase
MPTAPHGSWSSPISAAAATHGGIKFADVVMVDGEDVYWVESRPAEGGRSALVRRSADGTISDVGPDGFNVRTRVHEYGGGAYAVADGTVYASSFADQRIHRIAPDGATAPLTAEPDIPAGERFADMVVGDGFLIAVRESHRTEGEPTNDLVAISLGDGTVTTVVKGADFYAAPRISPDGTHLAWVSWDHPDMPWDATLLSVGTLGAGGTVSGIEVVAGGPGESVIDPAWSPDGVLHCISDRTGFWNLYRVDGGLQPVFPIDRDCAIPPWVFGTRRHAFLPDGSIALAEPTDEGDRLVVIAPDGDRRQVPLGHHSLGSTMEARGRLIVAIGSGPDLFPEVIEIDTATGATTVLRAPDGPPVPEGYVSIPEWITFDTPDGPAHALFYPPANPEFDAPQGDLPPLIVAIHGGPTSAVKSALDMEKLYWTSRGFGIVDVDYGGSTGYGREYRERLSGAWGVVDVRDCALAAAHLAERGLADPDRLLIHGGSAGGFTTLLALATRPEFAAGTSRYGVADLGALAEHTHKFEARYLDGLVGPYPEAAEVYEERSPMNHLDTFDKPVLLLQGSEDRVVPPEQSTMIRDALAERAVPVAYVEFEGEAHGFRSEAARVRSLEAELSFYATVLGFEDAGDDLEPLEIVNL